MNQVINPTNQEMMTEWLKRYTMEAIKSWMPAIKELLENEVFITILTKWYSLHMRDEYQRETRINALINGKEDFLGQVDEYNEKRAYGYSEVIYDILKYKTKERSI